MKDLNYEGLSVFFLERLNTSESPRLVWMRMVDLIGELANDLWLSI